MLKEDLIVFGILGALGVLVVGAVAANAKEVGTAVGTAAVDLVDGVVTGTVTSTGEAVGIPKTNQTECEKAKAEGRTWDASFACPAGDFLRYVFN